MAIRLLISDFDGTLVDTFEANYRAYTGAFESVGLDLGRERYRECFGFRFDRFMEALGISDNATREVIREKKAEMYPCYFDCLRVNRPLIDFISAFHASGGMTAIASTARGKNLRNALDYLGIRADFDLVLAGESVSKGKPDPEIYLTVLNKMGVKPDEALVFEDSGVGFKAAEAAGIRYIRINSRFFDNGN